MKPRAAPIATRPIPMDVLMLEASLLFLLEEELEEEPADAVALEEPVEDAPAGVEVGYADPSALISN